MGGRAGVWGKDDAIIATLETSAKPFRGTDARNSDFLSVGAVKALPFTFMRKILKFGWYLLGNETLVDLHRIGFKKKEDYCIEHGFIFSSNFHRSPTLYKRVGDTASWLNFHWNMRDVAYDMAAETWISSIRGWPFAQLTSQAEPLDANKHTLAINDSLADGAMGTFRWPITIGGAKGIATRGPMATGTIVVGRDPNAGKAKQQQYASTFHDYLLVEIEII